MPSFIRILTFLDACLSLCSCRSFSSSHQYTVLGHSNSLNI